ncbi:MAG TPA: S-adenosylmethionine decarboxylase [Terriglobales bacterium]|jgi:S-adenosylmethionine decarboxylase|nr:S-adenosylmethionine decarboxylase [Terriglobales bacterium]
MNGIEWIVEAHGCSPEALSDLSALRALFERIVGDLGLRPVGETRWHQFPQTGGITGLCLLAESHLACHTFPEFRSLCLNLFCCVPRQQWDFEGVLEEMFAADSVTVRRVLRPYISPAAPSDEHSLAVTGESPAGSPLG